MLLLSTGIFLWCTELLGFIKDSCSCSIKHLGCKIIPIVYANGRKSLSHFAFHPDQEIALFAAEYASFVDFWRDQTGQDPKDLVAEHSWNQACEQAALDPLTTLGLFALSSKVERDLSEQDWTLATLDELIDNIVSRHHHFVRVQLGRMRAIAQYLATILVGHGSDRLCAELTHLERCWSTHLDMEETQFFPDCMRIEHGRDRIPRRELDHVVESLQKASHDHRAIEDLADRVEQAIDQLGAGQLSEEQQLAVGELKESIADFIADSKVHAEKEDGVLIPAVMFVHDIRRSDSDSGACAD